MEIIILSKEKVKPSKPTPPNLRNHKLCLFDQLVCEVCIPTIFFYKNNNPILSANNIVDISRLKNSLSETLTVFYPLAGELSSKDSTFVDCNDNGVLYVEAHVKDNVRLEEFLRNPNLSQLIKFLPQNASLSSTMNYVQTLETLVSIQVTRFDCGGVAIGGVLFHKLLDGHTMSKFFNTWAKIARGDGDNDDAVDFTSSSLLFPPQNHFPQEFSENEKMIFFDEGKFLVRRFVFNAQAIESVKMKVSSENVPNPTRVEALTTFIWKHMILATRGAKGVSSKSPYMVTHVVNLRSRIEPKLPNAFGNLIYLANSEVIEVSHDDQVELPHLVGIVREMFESMNSKSLKVLQGDDAFDCVVDMATQVGSMMTQSDTYKFSSWCNLGLYNVDFGWGKPFFVAPFIDTISSLNKQQIILVENGRNDGIEAWILGNNEEMIELEKDEEFLAYASPNPSVQYDP